METLTLPPPSAFGLPEKFNHWRPEQMDAITAVSGSGPAYYALLAEAMIEAGILLRLHHQYEGTPETT